MLSGEERRASILQDLRESGGPTTGAEFARRYGVSRQVIVQDIALLRAQGENVVATPRGYRAELVEPWRVRAMLACRHGREQAAAELMAMVHAGLTVRDVIVEHSLYGELRGVLMIDSPEDVKAFIHQLEESGAELLSSLTGGVHLHTVEAPRAASITEAMAALRRLGILLEGEG